MIRGSSPRAETGSERPASSAGVYSPTGGEKHIELSPIHDFAGKLRQRDLLPRVMEYARWQARLRGTLQDGASLDSSSRIPDFAPISINLDITTACNYACDHCVDMEILNKPIKYDHERLLDSLRRMAAKGLRSVIVIGGGEPTVYPKFVETLRMLKGLGLQVSVVSNGSGMKKIAEAAPALEACDWVRLSLDSASDEVFQAMHKPKRRITLDEICEGVAEVKAVNARFPIGFSFIVTWKGAFINDAKIVENIQEIVAAAERAKRYGFDYIAYKPFLTRAESNHAEVVDLREADAHFERVIRLIRERVDEAKRLESPAFKVYETTNLKVLENRSFRNYTVQPHNCHMQSFRQVLSPLGMYNCPVYRNQPHGRLGGKDAYASDEAYAETRESCASLIGSFDATEECKEVTCLYNHANWWLESLIENPRLIDEVTPNDAIAPDFFL